VPAATSVTPHRRIRDPILIDRRLIVFFIRLGALRCRHRAGVSEGLCRVGEPARDGEVHGVLAGHIDGLERGIVGRESGEHRHQSIRVSNSGSHMERVPF